METICSDLEAEHTALDTLVSGLDDSGWQRRTPFLNWRIRDVIRHLAYFDDRAVLAATDPEAFGRHLEDVMNDYAGFDKRLQEVAREKSPAELMQWWRRQRSAMLEALRRLNRKERLPWYGPPMSALLFATARLMETWAHGQDIYDTLRMARTPTDRLRHIAHLGVMTFGWTYLNRGLAVPQTAVRVALKSPGGAIWTWGPDEAGDTIRGPAQDFCLVVTQRRHAADTALEITGAVAGDWMEKAQCFAGPAVEGPRPGQRVVSCMRQ